MKERPRVLVVHVVPTLGWRVTRCLASAGFRPVVLGRRRLYASALLPDAARFIRLRHAHWRGLDLDARMVDEVEATVSAHDIDVIVPADYDTTLLLSRHAAQLAPRLIAVPTPEQILSLHDKWAFTELVGSIGLAHPASALLERDADVEQLSLSFPVVTKPLALSYGVGMQVHETPTALRARARARSLTSYPLIAQERVPGIDVGCSFLAEQGALVACSMFTHRSNRERTFFHDDALLEAMQKLARQTKYHGVAHVDARRDARDGVVRLFELNPRFWGSLLFARTAGLNYPALVVERAQAREGLVNVRARSVELDAYDRIGTKLVGITERARNRLDFAHERLFGAP